MLVRIALQVDWLVEANRTDFIFDHVSVIVAGADLELFLIHPLHQKFKVFKQKKQNFEFQIIKNIGTQSSNL